jgi:hypothetical protein
MLLASRLASVPAREGREGSVLTIGTVTPAEEINVAKRMLAEKLLHLGLAHPPRHKQEWLLNLESFTDIYRKSEEMPNDSLSCRADGLNFHLGKPCMPARSTSG